MLKAMYHKAIISLIPFGINCCRPIRVSNRHLCMTLYIYIYMIRVVGTKIAEASQRHFNP